MKKNDVYKSLDSLKESALSDAELVSEALEKAELDRKAFESARCGFCDHGMKAWGAKYFEAILDAKKVDNKWFHRKCILEMNKWTRSWLAAWAEIGWHAKQELMLAQLWKMAKQ